MATNLTAARVNSKALSRHNQDAMRVALRTALNPSDLMQQILPEDLFLGILCLERKRAERSGRKFLLLLLDATDTLVNGRPGEVLKGFVQAANSARRETDPAGWYKQDLILGVMFTELGPQNDTETIERLLGKVHQSLSVHLSSADVKQIQVSVHIFPDGSKDNDPDMDANSAFYPDLFHLHETKKVPFLVKRMIDILGSLAALILFSPAFLLIAILVKLTSRGAVLFKQERLGQFGKTFTFLKFRSMYVDNDLKIHQEFMKDFIRDKCDNSATGVDKPVYKMTNDPRVTRIGRILRQTSLDELPQFINVLKGEMSLVGPRPPLAYEYAEYEVWHRRRVLEVKPGITGLWQVKGRSRVRFNDIVRLDLQYARSWSVWLDIQILLQTPRAVLMGDGAY
jgi:lipopolysaccharide/colanic/teichoic acid biosynthesis glycosyltransferase